MTIVDPIADMLTRIRNAVIARHDSVVIPASNVKLSIANILREEGFIADFNVAKGKVQRTIKIQLKYDKDHPVLLGLERVSKPGLKVYVKKGEIPRVYGGLGLAIVSTSKGVMTGKQAYKSGLGGELVCYVW